MNTENDGDFNLRRIGLSSTGAGMLRFALLFGSAGLALALILAPIAERQTRPMAQVPLGVDTMSTGSIATRGIYTERRSVLQPMPDSLCIIRANGTRTGDC